MIESLMGKSPSALTHAKATLVVDEEEQPKSLQLNSQLNGQQEVYTAVCKQADTNAM